MRCKLRQLKRLDYRHFVCIGITVSFIALGFLFPNSIARIGEAGRDLGTSFVYYIYALFWDNPGSCPVRPTVMSVQEWQFAVSIWEPLRLFPWTWEEFKVLCGQYFALFASKENLLEYWWEITDFLVILTQLLSALVPLIIPIWLKARKYNEPREETEEERKESINKDSKHLVRFKKLLFAVVYPVARWIKSFVAFVKDNDKYYKTWLFIWALHFNAIAIGIAVFAFYLYFVVDFTMTDLYTQFIKLLNDLTPMIRFLPAIVWVVIGYVILEYISRKRAYAKLEHNERKNRGLINERGVVTIIYGNMGTGKTRMLTSWALSAEKQLRDQALEILLETDMKFPNFPWVNLRNEVKRKMEAHEIVDIFSIRRWVRSLKRRHVYISKKKLSEWYEAKVKSGKASSLTFDYDIQHYRTTYNDNLVVIDFFDAINDYAQAYFVYAIQTSLIFSNYSIRTDFDVEDNGHFPLYNDDFFHRNPKFMDQYSKYCHIIDFDTLRLGERMLKENPNKNALGFGVYVVSEIDKERKNELQIRKQEKAAKSKRKAEAEADAGVVECTQDNDLFNACIKMIRHCTVIANRVFVKVLCDLQRPEDFGASGRDVGEITFIDSKSEKVPTLPFYSPYWLIHGLYRVHSAFDKFRMHYDNVRSDNTLLKYLLMNITAVYAQYIDRTEKLFGCQTFHLEVESGRMDGDVLLRKFYGMDKKDFSKRYCTDAMSSIFDLPNTVSIADFCCYADILATAAERDKQHSHFQQDLNKATAA